MKTPYLKIIKIALFAAPIMGLSVSFPILFFSAFPFSILLNRMFFTTTAILLLWLVNIILLKVTEKWDKTHLRFLLSIVFTMALSLALFTIFGLKPNHLPLPPPGGSRGFTLPPLLAGQSNNILILFIIELVLSKEKEKLTSIENSELKIKNLEAQQEQLKQQIHPHFLFNSLNTLKSLIDKYPLEAEDYLVKLSTFLRYNLSSNGQNVIPLSEELKLCSDYLEIQKVRFKEALLFSIDINRIEKLDCFVPVFAIQLLIENAIKHNVLTLESPLTVKITIDDTRITVTNNLHEKLNQESSTGIGLKNLSERYRQLIKKEIEVIKSETSFEVILPL